MFTVDSRLQEKMREIRRALHRYPELSRQEKQTSKLIQQELTRLGINFTAGLAGTGVRAEIGAGENLPCIALRADMDALPVTEETGLDFSSIIPGVMHACGHDGHVAMLLGAACLLSESNILEAISGRVVLIFQPAEESGSGAVALIEENCLQDVNMIFCGHIDTRHPAGYLIVDQGMVCSYTDPFTIDIRGRGGHASRPHEAVDAVVAGAQLVMNLQTLISRQIDSSQPAVVTVGRLAAGIVHNVIADRAILEGTIRSTSLENRKRIIRGLKRIIRSVEEMFHAEISLTMHDGLPAVVNDEVSAAIAGEAAEQVVGADRVVSQGISSLGGEDFSFYQQKIPGAMIRFGAAKEEGAGPSHSGSFDFDERVLSCGAQWLATVAVHGLQSLKQS